MASTTTPRLSYFSVRGLAENIRLLLADAAVEYIRNDFGLPFMVTGEHPEGLVTLKASGDLDFGSVPLWEEEGLKLVQSSSILRHLARVHGYNGDNEVEAAKIDSVFEGCKDLESGMRKVFGAPADKQGAVWKETVDKDFPKWLGFFEALLKKSSTGFFVGKKLSYADIAVAAICDDYKANNLGLEAYPLLSAHLELVFSRPNIAKYVNATARFPSGMAYLIKLFSCQN